MIEYLNIKEEQLEKNLKIFFKSKKYEIDIKSINYFFETFLSRKLTIPKNINVSTIHFNALKFILKKLKKDNINDYESDNYYYNIYYSLYEKEEAFDFLMEKIRNKTNIDYLKGLLDPNKRRLGIKYIENTIECSKILMKV